MEAKKVSDIVPLIGFGSRVRKSPFFEATRRWGCKAYSTYNHMYMPLYYESPVADYLKLVNDVTLWDVGVERQLEITGPQAAAFTQYLTPRNLSTMQVGQCKYILNCDEKGGVINDPVLLKLGENHFWVSIADSDLLLWAKGLAHAGGWDVELGEPDVSPLQVQGPKSAALMADLFGPEIHELKYFWFLETHLDGFSLLVSRTGWSSERGYEIFLRDANFGDALWERIMAAGEQYGIAPAAPSTIRRIEGGMLSYGADMDLSVNPFELGLDRLIDTEMDADYVGKEALRKIKAEGISRKFVGLELHCDPLAAPNEEHWVCLDQGVVIGRLTSCVYSPRLEKNIGMALLNLPFTELGTGIKVISPQGQIDASVTAMPFYDPKKTAATGAAA